jgi:hypothetical protein
MRRTGDRLQKHLPASVGITATLFLLTAIAQWEFDGHNESALDKVMSGGFIPSIVAIVALIP